MSVNLFDANSYRTFNYQGSGFACFGLPERCFGTTDYAGNDNPEVITNTGLTAARGTTVTITNAQLNVIDVDNTSEELSYTLVNAPTEGTLMRDGIALTNGSTFTQQDIDSNLITYSAATSITQLTNNIYSDGNPQVSGSTIVWAGQFDDSGDITPDDDITGSDGEIFLYDSITGTTTQLTNNTYGDSRPQVSGSTVVWERFDGNDSEIFLYDSTTGTTTQITDNTYYEGDPQISGSTIVWAAFKDNDDTETVPDDSITDTEIFLYDSITGTTTQLTNDTYYDSFVQVSGSNVVWQGFDGNDPEIFLYNSITGITTQLTDNTYYDGNPQVSGSTVVWQSDDWQSDDGNDEIFLYDSITGTTTQLTNNTYDDIDPQVAGSIVAWMGFDGKDYEIFSYNTITGTTTQVTNNTYRDANLQISGSAIVWEGSDGNDYEIFSYDTITGTTTQLTNNTYDDDYPQISGSTIVWQGDRSVFLGVNPDDKGNVRGGRTTYFGANREIFRYSGMTSDSFSFSVSDGSGGVVSNNVFDIDFTMS